jgi:hypothetical protein
MAHGGLYASRRRQEPRPTRERTMKNEKVVATKKTGTLRPWLVDVTVEHLR